MKSLYEIRLISKSKKSSDAVQELSIYLKSFPNDVDAWLLMGELVDEKEQKLFCYRRALKIDLDNQIAQENIRKLVAHEGHKITDMEQKSPSIQTIQPEPNATEGPISKYIKSHEKSVSQSQTREIDTPKATNQRSKKIDSSSTNSMPTGATNNASTGCIVAIIAVIVLTIIGLISSNNESSTSSSSPRELTTQEKNALKAVQEQDTILANNMHESIGVIFVLLESEGHATSIDGWYVSSSDGYTSVYFYFYLDGNRENAEWRYYPTGRIEAKNDWAFAFMGE